MKQSEWNEWKARPVTELRAAVDEKRDELFRLRMRLYTGQLEKPTVLREVRRTIARLETLITAKERQA
jgi:large subunit ribosomal protein L29